MSRDFDQRPGIVHIPAPEGGCVCSFPADTGYDALFRRRDGYAATG